MNWQPIETAPKDGRVIEVAWIVNFPTVEKLASTWWSATGKWANDYTPTHWRPLVRCTAAMMESKR